MDLIEDDISSIVLENESDLNEKNCGKILSEELSSISEIAVTDPVGSLVPEIDLQTDIKTLRDKLTENVKVLHSELRILEENNKKELGVKKESKDEEVFEHLSDIKKKVCLMKIKLLKSEEMISEKNKENENLKQELKKLEVKVISINNQSAYCGGCQLF